MKQALIFANGDPHPGAMVTRTFSQLHDPQVIAADGGARLAAYYGFGVDALIGDMDSLTEREVAYWSAQGAMIERHPIEKDATDLELALRWTAHHGFDWIRIMGAVGGRFDQVLANVYLLSASFLLGCDVQLVAAKQAIRLLRAGETHLQGGVGDTISLVPIGGSAHGISTQGLRYALRDEALTFGSTRGISNVLQAEEAMIQLREGMLLLIHTIGKAD